MGPAEVLRDLLHALWMMKMRDRNGKGREQSNKNNGALHGKGISANIKEN